MPCKLAFGIGPAYQSGMGKLDNNKLFYVSGGLIIGLGLLLALFLNSKTNSFLGTQNDDGLTVIKTTAGHAYVQGAAPKSRWKTIGNPTAHSKVFGKDAKPFDSGYKPAASFANNYMRAQDANHPLIASAKFIKKKDKLKNKKKKADKLAKKKSNLDRESRFKPLSETPDSPASLLTSASTSNTAATVKPKKTEKEEEEENINTVEFWVEPIFVQEDPSAVSKLVDSYKGRKVSSGVFYDVVTQMNEDSRVNIREMGLVALGSSPSSQSFTQLTWIKHNDTVADLRTEAGRQIASYSDVRKLGYVVSALKSSDTSQPVALEALRTLTASTQKYSLQASGEGTPASSVDVADLEPRYSRALELIEKNNYANSSDAKVKAEAVKATAAMNKFITI